MRLTVPIRQMINNQTLESLKRSISKTILEATPHIQTVKENQVKILSQKLSSINDWYMKITGLDKVNLAQEKVTGLQEQLLNIQEKRRDVGRQLSDVRMKSMELQDEIHKIKRQDDLEKFLDLMKRETEVLKLEKSISKTFQDYDQAERELFTAFTDSIRDSHEKQRAQMEYTKYFGIVLSIAGSFLAFVYSTVKKEQLKKIIDERLENIDIHLNNDSMNKLIDGHNQMNENILHNEEVLKEMVNTLNANFKKMGEQYTGISLISNEKTENNFSGLKYIHYFGIVLGVWLIAKACSS